MISLIKKLLLGNNSREQINNILIYSHFENGILFLNDGTVVKPYEFRGSITERNDEQYYQALNNQLNNALSLLPVHSTLHKVDMKISKSFDGKLFGNNNTLDKDIADHYYGRTGLDHQCYIFLILGSEPIDNPLLTGLSKFNLNVNGAKKINTGDIKSFENSCNAFNAAINSSGLVMKPIEQINKLYTVINNCLNLKIEKRDRANCLIEGDIVKHKDYIEIGNKLCTYVTMASQPEKLYPTKLNENGVTVSYTNPLYNLPFPNIIHTTFQRLDREKKLSKIDNEKFFQLSSYSQNADNIKTEGSQVRFKQIQNATVKIREENLNLYNVSIAVGIFAKNEAKLQKRVNDCINAYHYIGIEPLVETYDNLNIHWSYMPGNAGNAYHIFCTTCKCASIYFNTDTTPNFSTEGISFIDRELYPVKYKLISDKTNNPHALVIGSSGTGKTFFVNHLLHTRHNNGDIQLILDQKGDYGNIVKSLGGTHIDYSAENPIQFNPFLIGTEINNERLEFLTNFILSIIGSDGKNTVEYAVILSRIKSYLQSEKGIATLTNFYHWNETQNFAIENFPENDFKVALELYATGVYSNLFNHTDVEDFSDIKLLSIDFTAIKDARYFKEVFIMVNQICQTIVNKYPSKSKAIYMDECWSQLNRNPAFIEYYIRVGRSQNVALHIITQGIDEILNTSIADTLIGGTDTKILLNHAGKSDQVNKISEAFSLSAHDKTLFESLTTGTNPTFREIFIKQKEEALVLGVEVPLNLIGLYTTKPAEKAAFNQLININNGKLRPAQIDFASLLNANANFVKINEITKRGIKVLEKFKAGESIIADINNGKYDYQFDGSEKEVLV